MKTATYIGLILSVTGVIIAGFGSYYELDKSRFYGPYANTVGIGGLVVTIATIVLLLPEPLFKCPISILVIPTLEYKYYIIQNG